MGRDDHRRHLQAHRGNRERPHGRRTVKRNPGYAPIVTATHIRRRIIGLLIVLAIAIALTASDAAHHVVRDFLAWAGGVISDHPRTGKVLFILLSAISAMLAFVSSTIFVPIAVYSWGARTTVMLLWLSWLGGGACSYLIGRTIGYRLIRWFVSQDRIDYYVSRITSEANFLTVLLFQLALPSEIPGYVLGTVRYRFIIYIAVLAVAEMPFAIGAVYLGDSFIHRDYLVLLGVGILGIVFSALAFHGLHRRIDAKP